MINYIIARNRSSTEWMLIEASAVPGGGKRDIFRMPADSCPMLRVIVFKAPGWEDAKRVFDGMRELSGRALRLPWTACRVPQSWQQVRIMVGLESNHDKVE